MIVKASLQTERLQRTYYLIFRRIYWQYAPQHFPGSEAMAAGYQGA